MPRAHETALVAIPMSEMQRSAAMRAVIVEQHQTAVTKPEQKVGVVSGFDEVEFSGIEIYDQHNSK